MLTKTKTSPAYYTAKGAIFIGDSRLLVEDLADDSVSLVITSPRLRSSARRNTATSISTNTSTGSWTSPASSGAS